MLGLAAWGGLYVFHQWQERHLVRRAAAFLSGGDYRIASLSARRAYQINPESVEATRMLAQIAQRAGDGTELEWRRKVVELLPKSVDDALALVRAALRSNELAAAERTLQSISESAQGTAGYHAALGRLAEIKGSRREAETHWAKAAELAPADAAYQTQLALVQLGSDDRAKQESARQTLDRLRSDPQQRAAATRALIMDGASRPTDSRWLRTLAGELQSFPDAAFGDRILYLEILRQLQDPGYGEYLAKLKESAPATAADLASLLSWMSTHRDAREAIEFVASLPPDVLTKWPVPLAVAESYAKAENWAGLERHARAAEWGVFNFIRHAYLSRAHRGMADLLAAEQEWTQAQKSAATRPQAIMMLARTVATWNWQKEWMDLLWTATKERETRAEALQQLYQQFAKTGDTAGLYRVLLRSTEVAPDDMMVLNNFAQVSLLLDADPERARTIAADLARKEPTNAAYVSTHAFGLYTRNDIGGALQAFEALTPEQLGTPSIAAYYGIILAAAGQKDRAREYLERGEKAFLLPEEKALLTKAATIVQ